MRTSLVFFSVTAGLMLAALPSASTSNKAATLKLKPQASDFYRMMLGDFEITVLSDGAIPVPLDKLLIGDPLEIARLLHREFLDLPVKTSINTFLINTGTKLILVDTGAGVLLGPSGGQLRDNMQASGYQPEQIDEVLLTHIHRDHSGGLMIDGKPTFPNAVVYVNKHDADFWLNPSNSAEVTEKDRHTFTEVDTTVKPIVEAGKLKTFTGDTELEPGIKAIATPGHTPGHTVYAIESQGQKLHLVGDIVHSAAVQFQNPSIAIAFDLNSADAVIQRKKVFADAAKQGYWVGAAHISFPGVGHIHVDGNSYAWVPRAA